MPELLGRQGRPAGKRRAGAEDAVRAHHAFGQIRDMHGSAFSAARTGRLAENFGHHLVHIDTLGNAMAVAAVGRRDPIVVIEMAHDPGGRGFLAGIEVNEAGNFAVGKTRVNAFFELADGAHRPIDVQQPVPAQGKGVIAHHFLPMVVFSFVEAQRRRHPGRGRFLPHSACIPAHPPCEMRSFAR